MNNFIRTLSIVVASAALFFSIISISVAKTPDGVTPANEGVCDDVKDATRGLYGLCVAYCEAKGTASANSRSNEAILLNYEKKMRDGDPQMSCLTYESESDYEVELGDLKCPTWTQDELNEIGNVTVGGEIIFNNDNSIYGAYKDTNSLYAVSDYYNEKNAVNDEVTMWASLSRALNSVDTIVYTASYNRLIKEGGDTVEGDLRRENITAEEFEACRLQILEHDMPQ